MVQCQKLRKNQKSNTLSFIYGGTIYDGTVDWYETFAKTVVNNIKDVSFNLYSQSLSSDSNSQSGLLNFRKGIKEENLLKRLKIHHFIWHVTLKLKRFCFY